MKTRGQECRRVRAGACVFVVYTVSERDDRHLHQRQQQHIESHQNEKRQATRKYTTKPRHHGLYTIPNIESVSCAGDI